MSSFPKSEVCFFSIVTTLTFLSCQAALTYEYIFPKTIVFYKINIKEI